VFEQGRLQMLSLFKAEDIPVTVGLVVDHSGSMNPRKTEVIEGAAAFVRASNSQDEEFVVNFNDEVRLGLPPSVPFTSNLEELTTALSAASAIGGTALYDAIAVALDRLRDAQKEKKVLILITDGEDNASRHSFAQVLRMAQALNVLIYSVGLFDNHKLDRNAPDFYKLLLDEDKRLLTQLAKETGGAAYFPKDPAEVTRVCQQIASDIRHQYTLGYNPKADDHGGYRKIRVKLVESGQGKLAVRTRTGYLFPTKLH
jgi:VWFA-related protein